MAIESKRLRVAPPLIGIEVEKPLPIASLVTVRVLNKPNYQEAEFRKVIQPSVRIDQAERLVTLESQGLSLTEEKRAMGDEAILIEVASRYKKGEGAIKQLYRFLIFMENGTVYCQRLPMGSWAPSEPDECFKWLGRGGLQQGDFVLLPRKRLPTDTHEVPRPELAPLWKRAMMGVKSLLTDGCPAEERFTSQWEELIGRHDPVGCRLFKRGERMYLVAPFDTVVEHPEHATLTVPKGIYELVEDRATSYWRKAID